MSDASPRISANSSAPEDGAQLQDLLPFTVQDRIFGVITDQVDATAEAKPFARLPHTPRAIVGVVCVRGRMLTVLDAAVVFYSGTKDWQQPLPYVVVLRGDEQLGLAAETCRDTITISAKDIERVSDGNAPDDPVVGKVTHGGEEILIFDARRLFARAVQPRERRRRRF